MTAAARASFISIWILVVGLLAVTLEVENVRAGARIRDLQVELDAGTERVRRLELRYNRLLSPDLLERELPPEMKEGREGTPAVAREP
jgi:hypothetical protein